MSHSKDSRKDLYTFQAKIDRRLYNRFLTEVKNVEGKILKWYVEDFMKQHLARVEKQI